MTVKEQLAYRLKQQARAYERGDLSKKISPKKPPHANEIKIRECMTCGDPFASEGVGNRLCPRHRYG